MATQISQPAGDERRRRRRARPRRGRGSGGAGTGAGSARRPRPTALRCRPRRASLTHSRSDVQPSRHRKCPTRPLSVATWAAMNSARTSDRRRGRAVAAAARPRAPRRRVEQGRGDHRQVRGRRGRGGGGHLHRRRAGLDPQPGHGPARRAGQHRRDPAGRDGPGPADPRHRAGLARLRRLRAARGRSAAAAARRARFATLDVAEASLPADQADPVLPAARDDHVRRERRLSAPGPHHVPPDQRRAPTTRPPTRTPIPSWARRGRCRSSTTSSASTTTGRSR